MSKRYVVEAKECYTVLEGEYDRLQSHSDMLTEVVGALDTALDWWSATVGLGMKGRDCEVFEGLSQTLTRAKALIEEADNTRQIRVKLNPVGDLPPTPSVSDIELAKEFSSDVEEK